VVQAATSRIRCFTRERVGLALTFTWTIRREPTSVMTKT
jgi:hypothetical protein